METKSHAPGLRHRWPPEALNFAKGAKKLPGQNLEQLVVKLQRITGNPRRECWRFLITEGLESGHSSRRWTDEELELARELIAEHPVEQVATRLGRSVKAVYSAMSRINVSLREVRCDLHTPSSIARVLHVRREEVNTWIRNGWLVQTAARVGSRSIRYITPDAFVAFWKTYQEQVLTKRRFQFARFEAFYQYCYTPKHTVGEQLLKVRGDKRERLAFAAASESSAGDEDDIDSQSIA